ncbi:MAG: hypothetical protein LKJ44_06820 [Bifidobacteriaceae bacterium]|jgi:hypothetical protein|nr:hypothetical protein [Bifidobacteriaceae bacterium]MCI1979400.1 hypothetical protein [Bifidobacteriaceae bacterium]
MDKQTSVPQEIDGDVSESPQEETPQTDAVEKPQKPKYVKVLRFIVAPILVGLAVVCGIFAWLTATMWKPDPTARATASTQTRYIATDPGVLPLGNEQVGISVKAATASDKICLAVGSSQDVAGWLASDSYTRVEGLTSWSELTTSRAQAASDSASSSNSDGSSADAADDSNESALTLEDSDMWYTTKCGEGSVSVNWKATDTDQSLIVDTNPDAAASETEGKDVTLALTWVRTTVLDLSTPLIFLGILLVIAAALCATVFSLVPERRRKQRAERARSAAAASGDLDATQVVEGAGGLDSPRWVHDHIESEHHKHKTSHRKDTGHRGVRESFFKKKNAGTHADAKADASSSDQTESPAIVDVQKVNMVARQQEQKSPSSTQDAMEEYFARLAQERLGEDSPHKQTKPEEGDDND